MSIKKPASPKLKLESEAQELPLLQKNDCCSKSSPCHSAATPSTHQTALGKHTLHSPTLSTEYRACSKTKIIVKLDVGYHNSLTIRGKGANLSWEKGVPLKNVKADEWIWETDVPFTTCEFKVLINDHHYEVGHNHHLTSGSSIQYTPRF